MENNTISVSVCCVTYNHEAYIRDCLDGFVMQKTSFPVEVIIHDDASTDNTAAIIREYAAMYPDLIKPIFQQENQYSKGTNIMALLFANVTGKYIALCDGDDYWTAPDKLQKQVDFLEANPDFAICFHKTLINWVSRNELVIDFPIYEATPEVTDIYDISKKNYIHTVSMLFRKRQEVLDTINKSSFVMGDYPLSLLNARYGKIRKLPDTMGVYRIHETGAWTQRQYDVTMRQLMDFSKQMIQLFDYNPVVVANLRAQYARAGYRLHTFFWLNDKMQPACNALSETCSYAPKETKIELEQFFFLQQGLVFGKGVRGAFKFMYAFLLHKIRSVRRIKK